MLTLESFEEAAAKVKEVTQETKLIYSSYFSDMTGNKVYLKPENMQRTGAYKVRGAYYKISTLSDEERNKGLITASAGNHAQGVTYAAHKYGVKAVIVMPTTTPLIKVFQIFLKPLKILSQILLMSSGHYQFSIQDPRLMSDQLHVISVLFFC